MVKEQQPQQPNKGNEAAPKKLSFQEFMVLHEKKIKNPLSLSEEELGLWAQYAPKYLDSGESQTQKDTTNNDNVEKKDVAKEKIPVTQKDVQKPKKNPKNPKKPQPKKEISPKRKPETKHNKVEKKIISKEEADALLKKFASLRPRVQKYAERLKNAKNHKERKNISYHNKELMWEYKRIGRKLDEIGLLPKSEKTFSPKENAFTQEELSYFNQVLDRLDALIDSLPEEKNNKANKEGRENNEEGENKAEKFVEAVDTAAKKAEGAKSDPNGLEAEDLEKIHNSGLLSPEKGKHYDTELKILHEHLGYLDKGVKDARRVLDMIAKIEAEEKALEKHGKEEKQEGAQVKGSEIKIWVENGMKEVRSTLESMGTEEAIKFVKEKITHAESVMNNYLENGDLEGNMAQQEDFDFHKLYKEKLTDLLFKLEAQKKEEGLKKQEQPKDIESKENLKVDYFSIPRSSGSFPLKFRRETISYEVFYKISSSDSQLGKIEYLSDKTHDREAINDYKAFLEPVAVVEGEERRDNACCIKMIEPGEMRKSGEEWVVVKKMRVRFLEREGVDEEEAYDKVLLDEYRGKIETSFSLEKDRTRQTKLDNSHYVFQLNNTNIFEYKGEREFRSISQTRDGVWKITTLKDETIFIEPNGEIVEDDKEKDSKQEQPKKAEVIELKENKKLVSLENINPEELDVVILDTGSGFSAIRFKHTGEKDSSGAYSGLDSSYLKDIKLISRKNTVGFIRYQLGTSTSPSAVRSERGGGNFGLVLENLPQDITDEQKDTLVQLLLNTAEKLTDDKNFKRMLTDEYGNIFVRASRDDMADLQIFRDTIIKEIENYKKGWREKNEYIKEQEEGKPEKTQGESGEGDDLEDNKIPVALEKEDKPIENGGPNNELYEKNLKEFLGKRFYESLQQAKDSYDNKLYDLLKNFGGEDFAEAHRKSLIFLHGVQNFLQEKRIPEKTRQYLKLMITEIQNNNPLDLRMKFYEEQNPTQKARLAKEHNQKFHLWKSSFLGLMDTLREVIPDSMVDELLHRSNMFAEPLVWADTYFDTEQIREGQTQEKNEALTPLVEKLKNTFSEFSHASKTMVSALYDRQEQHLSPLQTNEDFHRMSRLIQKLSNRENISTQNLPEIFNDLNTLNQLFEEIRLIPAGRYVNESIDNLEQLSYGARLFANFCEESKRKLIVDSENSEVKDKITALQKAFDNLSEQAGRLSLLSARLRESIR